MQTDLREMKTSGLMKMHDLDESDLVMVRKYGTIISPKLEEYAVLFYEWIAELPEYQVLFSNPEVMGRARSEQINYWRSFFNARVDDNYVQERRKIGEVHARVGLSLPSYFAAMNVSFIIFTKKLYDGGLYSEEYSSAISALTKLMHFDITIVVETYSRLINERISKQSKALMEMSTPVTQIWQDILMLPVVGIIDSKRAQDIMMTILSRIGETRAKVFIMDISGVAVVDSAVANHLFKITKSTGLMGCVSLISGISPAIAQTIVNLGINVDEVNSTATLRDALEQAFKIIGRTVT